MLTSSPEYQIERLLQYAQYHKLIQSSDVIQCRNSLLDLFQLAEPLGSAIDLEKHENAAQIIDKLLDYAFKIGILKTNTITERDLFDARIMGLLMPRQSEVIRSFSDNISQFGIAKATEEFYSMSKSSNYIRMDRVAKNRYWQTDTEYGKLDITINLSKPEKDPKDIAASKLSPQANYPRCLLCVENVGFAGNLNHPARQNHRIVPVALNNEAWYFQYSPYVYYNEHCILFNSSHVPMKISKNTFVRLFDFVSQFPHYFLGSNADLPIVGGSILSHDHFQGGKHIFPMEKASGLYYYTHPMYHNVKTSIIKWPMSVIRLSSNSKDELIELSDHILNSWKNYSDEANTILASSLSLDEKIIHNTVTPIVRKNLNNEFEIDIVLRNNRTSPEYPDGIFHPHKELHHIKKENIGLIEVMGLAVLPARLNSELIEIAKILTGEQSLKISDSNHPLSHHMQWINELIRKYGFVASSKVMKLLEFEVGQKFRQVLVDAGVFKQNTKGLNGFKQFMNSLGFKETSQENLLDITSFNNLYGNGYYHTFLSPGRINIIGEHIDYNGGFVFPCALDFGTKGYVRKRTDNIVNLASTNFDLKVQIDINDIVFKEEDDWANYPKGVLYNMIKDGYNVGGMDLLISGSIPNGAGLSSSASLELLIAVIVNDLFNEGRIDRVDLVKLCQNAENEFVGVNCGIMDQFAIGMGKKNCAIMLDCDSLEYQYADMDLKDYSIVIMSTNKRRALNESKYNERRAECDEALNILKAYTSIDNLCQLSPVKFEKLSELLSKENIRKRAAHAVYENQRVKDAFEALNCGDLNKLGKLLMESHKSLKDLYEVTGIELDTIVDEAIKTDGCIGARMTGAGFGGCAIAIVKTNLINVFTKNVGTAYTEKIGYSPSFYFSSVGEGTHEVK